MAFTLALLEDSFLSKTNESPFVAKDLLSRRFNFINQMSKKAFGQIKVQ